ncbi:hypothetical protein ACFX2I_014142 [Malus domestica]
MDPKICFSHRHSLTFKEEKKNDGPLEFCNGCLEPVLGPHDTCDTCSKELYGCFRSYISNVQSYPVRSPTRSTPITLLFSQTKNSTAASTVVCVANYFQEKSV